MPTLPPDGLALWERVRDLLPYWRCITGDGLRATLRAIGETVPIEITEVPSGTPVLDWTVPPEWRIREAVLARPDGTRVVDTAASPLHVVQYSTAVRERRSLAELRPHLHTLPAHPTWIPYRTDYYTDGWGLCLRQRTLDALAADIGEDGMLDVRIDADLVDGSLTYGEVVVPGETDGEVLISAHACHPALANDNAASIGVATALARALLDGPPLRHTVRFVFAPGTIGAIAWLAQNREAVRRIRHGLVLANLGDGGGFTYKRSRRGTFASPLAVDRGVEAAAAELGVALETRPFDPFGYDERQYGSPGFDLPVGRLTRTPHAEYPEYHTSADDLSLVRPEALAGSLALLTRIVERLDAADPVPPPSTSRRPRGATIRSQVPFGEPQLGRRGLYQDTKGRFNPPDVQAAIAWVLSLGDSHFGLRDVVEASGLAPAAVQAAAARLAEAGVIELSS